METSYLLSAPTLRAFVKGVEDSLQLIDGDRVGIIDLQFFPRFYFLSYGASFSGVGNPHHQEALSRGRVHGEWRLTPGPRAVPHEDYRERTRSSPPPLRL